MGVDKRLPEYKKKKLEECLNDLEQIKLVVSERKDDLIKIKTGVSGSLAPIYWAILDKLHNKAYVPSRGFFKKYIEGEHRFEEHIEAYDEMIKILEKEEFRILYYTNIKEL